MTNYEYKFVEVPAQEAGKDDASPFSYLVILEKEAN